MLASELILALRKIIDQYGDIKVTHHDDWGDFFIDTVSYRTECKELSTPAHILLTGDEDEVEPMEAI